MTIIVRLNGGLCNQIFQYAFARSLSKRRGEDFKLDIIPFLTYYKYDPYGLWKFNIKETFAEDKDMRGFVWLRKHNSFFSFIYHRFRLNKILQPWYYVERTFMFDLHVFSSKARYFEGFWQSEKYFKDIEDELRQEITLKDPLSAHSEEILRKIKEVNAVSLHVRRYAHEDKSPWHGFCTAEYYAEAMKMIAERTPSPHFFIFSDNYPWVKENFLSVIEGLGFPYTLVENDNDRNGEDLMLMSKCRHYILANSSFSWWGAWLNPSKKKTVIGPKKWFAHAPKNNTKDLLPEDWIRI